MKRASFLDRPPPFDFSDPGARDLWTLLAANYPSKAPMRDLLTRAGVDPTEIDWDQPIRWVWSAVLTLAHRQAKLRPLLKLIADSGDQAIAERISEILAADPVQSAPQPDSAVTTWKGFRGDAFERVIEAEPTFLDIAFLRRGVELGAAVCRLLVTMSGQRYYGTAFRIGEDLLLTNHHVLFDEDHGGAPATRVEAWFGYERTLAGLELQHSVVMCDPASVAGDPVHDWAVVRVLAAMPDAAPVVSLTGAGLVRPDDRVYIIQHPAGAPKKIGMIHNVVRHVDENVVQYLTDTEGGSSGSPVFDEQWQLIALHHQWVEVVTGGVREIRNQGRRIERVAEGLHAAKVM